MADEEVQTQSARLGPDYWLTLTRAEEPGEWIVRLLGKLPTFCTIVADNEDDARTLAVDVAEQYFRENDIHTEIPEVLRWTAATKLSFRVQI